MPLIQNQLLTFNYQNVIGMSVAGSDYDRLKKYNLAELYSPAATSEAEAAESTKD